MLKIKQITQENPGRVRMLLAFMAGMALTATLAQFPLADDLFSPRINHEAAAPSAPSAPDPAGLHAVELVSATAPEAGTTG